MTVKNSEAQLFILKKFFRKSTASPLRLLYCAFSLWWLGQKIETDIYMKGAQPPEAPGEKWGFVSAPSVTWARLLPTPPCLAHFLSSTAQSHIPNQTFTHPRWRLSVTRSFCEAERSSCSQVSRSCLAGCRAAQAWRGLWWVNPGPKGGRDPRWRPTGEKAAWSVLYTTRTRGKVPARVSRPVRKQLTHQGRHQLFVLCIKVFDQRAGHKPRRNFKIPNISMKHL